MGTIFIIKRELSSGTKVTIIKTKKRIRGNSKNNRKKQKINLNNSQGRVEKFPHVAKRGHTFIYIVCNRCLYARSVMEFQFNKYNLDLTIIIYKVTKNDTTYICNTYHSYLKKSHIPAQAVCNKFQIFEAPVEIKNLNRLERILIARRIFYSKKLQLCQKVSSQNLKVLIVIFQLVHQILQMFFHTVRTVVVL